MTPMRVLAHVDYVTDPVESTDPIGFLLEALGRPGNALVLLVGAVLLLAGVLAWARIRPLDAPRGRFLSRAETYTPYLPWIVRLSAGILLTGSGLSRVLIYPTLEAPALLAILITACGFLILLGLAVRPAALVALLVFGATLVANPELVMMLDLAGALVAALLLGPGTPSLDDLLRAAFPRGPGARMATENAVEGRVDDVIPLVVRLGLGSAFAASGIIDKLVLHDQALAAVEKYGLTSVVPVGAELWVIGAFATETALGVAIMLGVLTRASAVLGFVVLTLALFGLPDDPVIAHVCLFGLSSILVITGAGRYSLDRQILKPLGERLRR